MPNLSPDTVIQIGLKTPKLNTHGDKVKESTAVA